MSCTVAEGMSVRCEQCNKKAEARMLRLNVSEMRIELTRPNGHYPLKVARLPIPPPGQRDSKE